jgi:hypothetical protein
MRRRVLLCLAAVLAVNCSGVPSAPGVNEAVIRRGIIGTWESNTVSGAVRNHLKKRYYADGTAESWLTLRVSGRRVGLHGSPVHLTSRWRHAGDVGLSPPRAAGEGAGCAP